MLGSNLCFKSLINNLSNTKIKTFSKPHPAINISILRAWYLDLDAGVEIKDLSRKSSFTPMLKLVITKAVHIYMPRQVSNVCIDGVLASILGLKRLVLK